MGTWFRTADNRSLVRCRVGILAWIRVQKSHSFLIRHRISDIMKPSEWGWSVLVSLNKTTTKFSNRKNVWWDSTVILWYVPQVFPQNGPNRWVRDANQAIRAIPLPEPHSTFRGKASCHKSMLQTQTKVREGMRGVRWTRWTSYWRLWNESSDMRLLTFLILHQINVNTTLASTIIATRSRWPFVA